MKRILVVGSLNMDIVIETPCMPKAGETIAGKSIAPDTRWKRWPIKAFAAGKLGRKHCHGWEPSVMMKKGEKTS